VEAFRRSVFSGEERGSGTVWYPPSFRMSWKPRSAVDGEHIRPRTPFSEATPSFPTNRPRTRPEPSTADVSAPGFAHDDDPESA